MEKAIVTVIILCLLLCGCTRSDDDNGVSDNKRQAPPQQEQPQPQPQLQPQPQQEAPEPAEVRLAAFKTSLHDKSEGRLTNISLAIKAINGLTLAPGGEFSFNKTVGERSEARGYKKARVMQNEDYIMDFGGGVCQVSTTLFNAASLAGLKITERHSHKKPVSYVAEGSDAAVNYGTMDLRIVNSTDAVVRFELSQGRDEIYANVVQIK